MRPDRNFFEKFAQENYSDYDNILGVHVLKPWDFGIIGFKLKKSEYQECIDYISIWKINTAKYYIYFEFDKNTTFQDLKKNKLKNHIKPILIFHTVNSIWLSDNDLRKIKKDIDHTIEHINELTLLYDK